MNAHEIWWSLGIMVATVELFFGALYLAAIGLALVCAGVAARFGAGLAAQFGVAAIIAAAAIALLRRRDRRRATRAGVSNESGKG